MDYPMASVLAKLGYGWYEQMLSEVGVSTVGDLMASATAAANDDDDGARRDRDRVAAFLTANAFSAAHADAIAEEILEIARATEKDKRRQLSKSGSADGMFMMDTLDGAAEVRSIHWSPYDRVRVVNADP
jgi:SAM-dependent MidA family methyltransferase